MDNPELIRSFLEYLRVDRGAADRTLEAYRRDLLQLAEWAGKRPFAGLSLEELSTYATYLSREGNRPASIARKLSAIRQLYKHCCLEHAFEANPSEQLGSPALPAKIPRFLSVEECDRLLESADRGIPYPRSLGPALRLRDR
ncbi:MAG TPA: site-specific integrase, partial [Bdellovibrionota bacterium]|nr:site-specific integrase [Bdellovibrionota bacterium]